MDKATLVGIDLLKSERIVSALESSRVRVSVAIWVQFPEYEDWRLVIASKDLDDLDLGEAYLKVNRILKNAGMTVWDIPLIFIMQTTDRFIRALRKTFGKASTVVGMRLGAQTWGDRYVDEALAYKIA
jgi:hypothetical protein